MIVLSLTVSSARITAQEFEWKVKKGDSMTYTYLIFYDDVERK
jgi:hypothetical protein